MAVILSLLLFLPFLVLAVYQSRQAWEFRERGRHFAELERRAMEGGSYE